nr:MAG TPA: hypothetical protein [Caudoviricetes sp.]
MNTCISDVDQPLTISFDNQHVKLCIHRGAGCNRGIA